MQPMVWWIVISVVFFIMELVTASFFFIWIALGALVTAAFSYFFKLMWLQCAIFAAGSIFFVLVSRFWKPSFSRGTRRSSNMDALVGCEGMVTQIDATRDFMGYIKVEGQDWKVITRDQTPLQVRAKVSVLEAKGNILTVQMKGEVKE